MFKEKGYFKPTEQGELTAKNLIEYFDNLINTKYTSLMEEQLDSIALGEEDKVKVLTDFYKRFNPLLEDAHDKMPFQRIVKEIIEVGEECPLCGKPLVYRYNRKNERFIGCSGFSDKPRCKYTRSIEE